MNRKQKKQRRRRQNKLKKDEKETPNLHFKNDRKKEEEEKEGEEIEGEEKKGNHPESPHDGADISSPGMEILKIIPPTVVRVTPTEDTRRVVSSEELELVLSEEDEVQDGEKEKEKEIEKDQKKEKDEEEKDEKEKDEKEKEKDEEEKDEKEKDEKEKDEKEKDEKEKELEENVDQDNNINESNTPSVAAGQKSTEVTPQIDLPLKKKKKKISFQKWKEMMHLEEGIENTIIVSDGSNEKMVVPWIENKNPPPPKNSQICCVDSGKSQFNDAMPEEDVLETKDFRAENIMQHQHPKQVEMSNYDEIERKLDEIANLLKTVNSKLRAPEMEFESETSSSSSSSLSLSLTSIEKRMSDIQCQRDEISNNGGGEVWVCINYDRKIMRIFGNKKKYGRIIGYKGTIIDNIKSATRTNINVPIKDGLSNEILIRPIYSSPCNNLNHNMYQALEMIIDCIQT